jgi:glycosyltransferase involved in cell wall biosynthesis
VPADSGPIDVTVVIPLRDEEPNVGPLYEELHRTLLDASGSFELIFVDDGSTDATFERLREIHRRDGGHVRAIRLARRSGQSAAFEAGFARARGRFIVTSDGDLQVEPTDIPRLLALAATHDIVCGWRRDRQDVWLTRHLPSMVANWLIGVVTGVRLHDQGCSLKVFRSAVVKPLRLRPGMHRYLPAIAAQLGGRVIEIGVHHRRRRFGRSKYGLGRVVSVVGDLVRLRRLMREAIDPDGPSGYEIAQVLE